MTNKWVCLTAVLQFEKLKNCTSKRLSEYLEELNSKNFRLIEFIKPNVLVFKTMDEPAAGRHIENWLLANFKKRNTKGV